MPSVRELLFGLAGAAILKFTSRRKEKKGAEGEESESENPDEAPENRKVTHYWRDRVRNGTDKAKQWTEKHAPGTWPGGIEHGKK